MNTDVVNDKFCSLQKSFYLKGIDCDVNNCSGRYYSVSFIGNRTVHPLGPVKFFTLINCGTKKEARYLSSQALILHDYENALFYRSPDIQELSKSDYVEAWSIEKLKLERTIEHYCALFSLFGYEPEFDDDEKSRAVQLILQPYINREAYNTYKYILFLSDLMLKDKELCSWRDGSEELKLKLVSEVYERCKRENRI